MHHTHRKYLVHLRNGKSRRFTPAFSSFVKKSNSSKPVLEFFYVDGLRPLSSTFLIEANSLTLFQALKTLPFNGAVMDKKLLPAVSGDKSITFFVIEPLHSTFRHVLDPFANDESSRWCVTSELLQNGSAEAKDRFS
jgi:hypothetical protein